MTFSERILFHWVSYYAGNKCYHFRKRAKF